MIGSELLSDHPFFRGHLFGLDDVDAFGFYNFRDARITSDSWARHPGMEIVVMLTGEACWELEDGSLASASGSEIVVFPPGAPHRVANGVYTPSSAFWLVFRSLDEPAITGFLSQEERVAFQVAASVHRASKRAPEALNRMVLELCGRLVDPDIMIGGELTKAEIRSLLYAAIVAVWKHLKGDIVRTTSDTLGTLLVNQAAESDEDRIVDLARASGYSRSQFYDIFNRTVGMPPNDYRRRLRIKQCCGQLVQTDLPVGEIALNNGFSSAQYFSRVFRKYVGLSPTDYRQEKRGGVV